MELCDRFQLFHTSVTSGMIDLLAAELGVMGPIGAIEVLYNRDLNAIENPDERAKFVAGFLLSTALPLWQQPFGVILKSGACITA